MASQGYHHFSIILLVLLASMTSSQANEPSNDTSSINRKSFPEGFIFGASSSAYQSEGAANEGDKGASIWDNFTHINGGERILDKSNGDVATDSYHRYKEDVALIKEIGLDAFRISISWPRILKSGKLSGGVNKEGISYYNNLINELLANGIQPFVTLYHWDLPQALQDEYGGFSSFNIVNDFQDYADVCFREFGDRVKNWITLNEPWMVSVRGYAVGNHPPGHCSDRSHCVTGDMGREVYVVTHNQLLAHAAVVHLYKDNYEATQKGKIGITLLSHWYKPVNDMEENKQAAERALDFMLGWFMEPLTNGDYPLIMQSLVGDRLPKFTKEESEKLKGSFDFLGLTYYTAYSIFAINKTSAENYFLDSLADINFTVATGPQVGKSTFFYPSGIQDLLLHVKTKYNNPPIYITKNGIDQNSTLLTPEQTIADKNRIEYLSQHLFYLQNAITKDGVNVKGYFVYSLTDNFEWEYGYSLRFGICHVDFQNGLKRSLKDSARWFKNFLVK